MLKEKNEYNILYAKDGEDGLKMVEEIKPNLVILDLMLPKIDGLTVCKQIKDKVETRLTKIILLTARVDEDARLTALKNGADDFVTKPFSSLEIKSRVRNLLLFDRNQDLQNALKKLKETQLRLVQSKKLNALGNLSAGLLHEINNPLNYTITALEIVKKNENVQNDENLQDMIEDMDEGMNRIKDIITSLRAFAYPGELDKQAEFSLSNIVQKAIRFTLHDNESNIIIDNRITNNLIVKGSESHILQILINLIINSFKAIRKTNRNGKITINCDITDQKVFVNIEDNGCGISKQNIQRIFNPFFTTGEVGESMGMGLSICNTIIESHGGNLTVKSKEREYSIFSFDLKLSSRIKETIN